MFGMAILMIDMYCTDERLQDESDSLGKYLEWYYHSLHRNRDYYKRENYGDGFSFERRRKGKDDLLVRLNRGNCNSWDVIFQAIVLYPDYDPSSFPDKTSIAIHFYSPGKGTPFYQDSNAKSNKDATLTWRNTQSIEHPNAQNGGQTIHVRLLQTHSKPENEKNSMPSGHYHLVWPSNQNISWKLRAKMATSTQTQDETKNLISMTEGGRVTL